MLDNQMFRRADSRIIFIKVLHDHCHIGGPLSPMREAGSDGIKIHISLASCLSGETMKKGIIQNFQFYGPQGFISQLVVDDGFRLPLTSPADPKFFCVVIPSKRLGLSVLTHLQKFRWSLPRFKACL